MMAVMSNFSLEAYGHIYQISGILSIAS